MRTIRRPAPLTLLVLVLGLTLLAVPADARREKRVPPGKWIAGLSEAKYSAVVSSTHSVEAVDGTQLTLTLHLPDGLPANERVPTLLQITPYQPLDQALGELAYSDYYFFVLRGAAYVEADARGTGGSEGCLDFGGSDDRWDARIFVDWIRDQPWSNGRVVTDGVSHPGMGSVVAHAAVPELTGALAHAPVVSYYQDEWLQGAKFEDQLNGPAYQGIEALPPQPPAYADPEALKAQAATCTGETLIDYAPVDGPFTKIWADRDLSRHSPDARTPILLTHGFVDQNVHPDHSQLYWDALPDDYPKYAIFGWWYHGWPDMAGHPFVQFDWVRHRWLDALLFGVDNGLWLEPRVLVEDSRGNWHEGDDWPLEESRRMTFYPSEEGALRVSADRPGSVTYSDAAGAERGAWVDAHVAFRSAPLKQDRLVNGAPTLDLVASSTT
ncbi:MAG: CocE/NonD family hydrolase, partial [Actinomycetota bacterium]